METSWKPHGNLMETSRNSHKPSQNPVKRPCKPVPACNTRPVGLWDGYYRCVLLPLGSPTTGPKCVFPLPHGRRTACSRCAGTGVRVRGMGRPGGYTGWVIPGHPAPRTYTCKAEQTPAERAPEAPARGLEWVGVCAAPPYVRSPPLRGRSWPCRPLPGTSSSNAASWPIRTRFRVPLLKVSQNGQVSPEKCNKACHSPYIQKRVQKVAS